MSSSDDAHEPMEHADITEKVIGCAYRVYNKLGYGFRESVYERSMMVDIRKRTDLSAERQLPIDVFYKGENVGHFDADVLVEDVVILELKSVEKLVKAHEVQLVNYLTATGKDVGLLINFGPDGVEIRRKGRVLRKRSEQ